MRRKKVAFTLLEVTMATVMVSLFFFLSWLLIPRAIMVEKETMLRDFARLLATQELSDFRALPAEAIKVGVWRAADQSGPEDCTFRVMSEIYAVEDYQPSDLREVRVTVTYRYRGSEKTLKARTEACSVDF